MSENINQIKNKIKQWEREFLEINNRKPKGNDIQSAPKDVINYYKLYKSQKVVKPNPNETINLWDIKSKDQILKPNVENNIIKLQEEKIRKNLKACREKHKLEMKRNKNIILNDKENINISQSIQPVIPETNSKSFEIEIKEKIEENISVIKYPIKRKYCESETSFPNLKRMSFIEKAATINIDDYFQEKSTIKKSEEESKIDKIIPKEKPIEIQSINSSQSIEPVIKKPNLNNSTSFKNPNENYVKLNKKFKCFSRKGSAQQKSVRNSIHRAKWKKARGFGKCFRCGEEGHYANNCSIRAKYGPTDEKSNKNVLGFTDMCDGVRISDFRLQNSEELNNTKQTRKLYFQISTENKNAEEMEEEEQQQIGNLNEHDDDMEECLKKSLKIFGFSSFRNYQEKIIRRILAGKSTIAVLPTGSGKSLCYQIPAYIYQQTKQSVALIVSPLISLMQDQLAKLPKEIKGIALNSTLKYEEKLKVLKEINDLQYAFVLLSPEALVESNWLTADKLTAKISFACIDEVHCLSDWSHHFRPSYLRVCKILRDKYRVNCFLGLSATCTLNTIDNIGKLLQIDRVSDRESCIKHTPIPENITISVIEVKNKEKSLLELLQKPPFSVSSSILIYCASREETVYLSSLIRDNLQSSDETTTTTIITVNNKQKQQKTKKKLTWTTQAYHAGLSLSDRSKHQKMFMRGRTRVLVATVAFGMGLDKPDIRAVIHYSRPRSFENYVQEIGRAGRDSLPSHALVMVYKDELKQQETEELNELHRHTFGNHVELIVLKRFVKLIFTELLLSLLERSKKCVDRVCRHCRGHIVGFSPSEIAEKLNIREETLMTLLCYMELYEEMEILKILPANYRFARISCYRGPQQLADLSQKSLPISISITNQYLNRTIDLINCRSVELDMIEIWEKYDIDVSIIRKELKSFEWNQTEDKEGNIRYSNTGISNDFTQWNWILAVRCDIDENSLDKIVDHLYNRLKDLENKTVDDVEILYNLLKNNRTEFSKLYSQEADEELVEKSTKIRNAIIQYFDEKGEKVLLKKELNKTYSRPIELEVRSHIRAFVTQYKSDNSMTGRSVASVFHGINCPNFPSLFWSGQKTFWKSTLYIDFITLMNWANEELRYLL